MSEGFGVLVRTGEDWTVIQLHSGKSFQSYFICGSCYGEARCSTGSVKLTFVSAPDKILLLDLLQELLLFLFIKNVEREF